MSPKRREPASQPQLALLQPAVDVDLVRFEKNLLQIGFFGANDARDKERTSRRIEQIVFRNGHKIKVAAEFRGSQKLGLPCTTDRDKFIALLKIVSEERQRAGHITNPIRFSGYRMIQELGLSRNGEIYEEILRWGQRMTDTTITSEQVVYFAAKKIYSDEVLHVFRSFRRTGSSKLNGTEKQEHYEVILEDWLLENLNQRYVIPEDFNAYKQLTRPTAKGIFGNLHLWFHASHGKQVEKDYAELCNLLNVQVYPHLSKIKSTMGLALDELVKIQYISRWDVQPMSTKRGYKIVLTAGEELLRILQTQRPEGREPGNGLGAGPESVGPKSAAVSAIVLQEAIDCLKRLGVLPAKARQLVEKHGADEVVEASEYLESQLSGGKRRNVENPAGLLIYLLENDMTVPGEFVSSRRRKALEKVAKSDRAQEEARLEQELAYAKWVEQQRNEVLESQYTAAELQARVDQIVKERVRNDEAFRRVPARNRAELARRILMKDVCSSLTLPSFEEWLAGNLQKELFGRG